MELQPGFRVRILFSRISCWGKARVGDPRKPWEVTKLHMSISFEDESLVLEVWWSQIQRLNWLALQTQVPTWIRPPPGS